MTPTVLILGGNGRFGRNATEAFETAGWIVRQFDRATDNLWDAAWGAQVIVNAWNAPYADWATVLPLQTRQVIEVAEATGATVIVPGNVYVFGTEAPEAFGPQTPHAATNPLGRLRVEMEAAYRNSNVRTIILRGGDFLDTQASGNWFDMIMAKPLAKGKLTYPGPTDRPHAWAYLPDMARAAVKLAEMRDDLNRFEDVPFPGYTLTGEELTKAVAQVMGTPIKASPMSWTPLQIARPFWKMAKHLVEMRYLWSKPHHLDATRFDALLPDFRHTPLEHALASALQFQINPDKAVA
ncbi:epimerase [Actibacterium mucosum KCTC 23349]|uniref:Epimerase n=1 Tax=Actibacterium mucosum KCTC 23349 TaxID=1454373 RepID=A0A037ZP65_9RHOB|nr:sugar nucleotide-binding protein [Actibacterium mucosum]KAJ57435.1 epimerase [Actibacterium mucosum KCTC 23349]